MHVAKPVKINHVSTNDTKVYLQTKCMPVTGQRAPGFLTYFSADIYMCVSTPEAINN